MRRITILLTAAVSAGMCWAQSSENAQAAGRATQSTSVSANKSGAQASSSTSATASQKAAVSGESGQTSATNQLQAGSTVQAELTKPLDVRKNKVGDEVIAKTTQDVKSNGHVVLPKGSKIVGRVTHTQARTKGQEESQLGLAFDHAILKDGTQVPIAFTIQAIGRSEAAASAVAEDDAMMPGGNPGGRATTSGNAGAQARGGLGSAAGTVGSVVNTAGSAAGATLNTAGRTGAGVAGELNSTSHGTVGLSDLTLSSSASSATSAGSVIRSSSSNVRLDSRTRMILSVSK
jgi:hypothetical protein